MASTGCSFIQSIFKPAVPEKNLLVKPGFNKVNLKYDSMTSSEADKLGCVVSSEGSYNSIEEANCAG